MHLILSKGYFWQHYLYLLSRFTGGPILFDRNINFCQVLDHSYHLLSIDIALSAAFQKIQKCQVYAFYSKANNSYTRIDYLLFSNELKKNVIYAEIWNIIISDYGPFL